MKKVFGYAASFVIAAGVAHLIFFWSFWLALWRYWDVPPEIRTAVFERNLTGMHSSAAILLPSGAMAIVRRSDVASIGESRCTRESKCYGRRCSSNYVSFACGYRITLRDGRGAVAYMGMSAEQGGLPRIGKVKADEFEGHDVRLDEAAAYLCEEGFGCRTDPPRPAIPDPDSRVSTDCRGGFCAPSMVAIPPGRYRRGSTREEMALLTSDGERTGAIDPFDLERAARETGIDYRAPLSLYEDEGPVHEVEIGYRFAMGRHEVTVAEWNACVAEKACPGEVAGAPADEARKPATDISWIGITQSYLPWLNRKLGLAGAGAYRLPSEAEWEYAARAGAATRYAAGDILDTHSAHFYSSWRLPAGSFPPNAFGLHDMAGNAAEWVQDCVAAGGYERVPRDGSAYEEPGCTSRIYRDANWQAPPWQMRAANRSLASPDSKHSAGFRLARTLQP